MMMFPVSILAIEDDSDRAFMEQLYTAHELLMHKCALRFLHNGYDADDAVNNACVKLIKTFPNCAV